MSGFSNPRAEQIRQLNMDVESRHRRPTAAREHVGVVAADNQLGPQTRAIAEQVPLDQQGEQGIELIDRICRAAQSAGNLDRYVQDGRRE